MTTNQPRRGPDLFWPIILIGAGVIFLLANLGIISSNPWPIIWNLWPVILIVIGLDILFGRRTLLGGVVGAALGVLLVVGVIILLIAQPNLPGLNINFNSAQQQTRQIQSPLGGIETATVSIDFSNGQNRLYALSDSDQLIDGQVSYVGDLTFDVNASGNRANVRLDSGFSGMFFGFMSPGGRWDVGLNTRPDYDLNLEFGSGGGEADVSQLQLTGGTINAGSGHVDLRLPASGNYTLGIDSGSGGITIRVPRAAGVRVEYDGGSGGIDAGGRLNLINGERGRDGVYETEGFGSATDRITLNIDGGSGRVSVTDLP